ncbi:MAG: hypothetical protein ACI4XW_08220 [Candidatus Spyradocola sp.]
MKKKLLAALLCAFFALAAVCLFCSRSWLLSGTPRVQTQPFGYGSLHKKYSLSGTYRAQDAAEVIVEATDEFTAVVQEVCVTPGQRVQAGDVLYRCAVSPELEQRLASAKEALDTARLALMQEERDEVLYAAYARYIAAEDAALLAPEDEQTQKAVREAREALSALTDTRERQAQLNALRSRSEKLRRCEENYLALKAARDGLSVVRAPRDGIVAEVRLEAGDALRTGVCCAVVAGGEELAAQFPVTQEQAAFFSNRAGIGACRIRIGNALVQAREPELVMRGGQGCLQVTAPFDSALYGANATMEVELLTAEGVLLPRSAVCGEQGRQVTFYVLEQRNGFFGTEIIAQLKTAVLLDWDEDNTMVLTDLPLVTPVIVSASGDLTDGCTVLVTDE